MLKKLCFIFLLSTGVFGDSGVSVDRPVSNIGNTYIEKFDPTFGPIAGGTKLKITGKNFKVGTRVSVSISNTTLCKIDSWKNEEILCTTMKVKGPMKGGIELRFLPSGMSMRSLQSEDFEFTYLVNPVVEKINLKFIYTILSGGFPIKVHGINLDHVKNPLMWIEYGYQTFEENCVIETPELMVCLTPKLEISLKNYSEDVKIDYGFKFDGFIEKNCQINPEFPEIKVLENPIVINATKVSGELVINGENFEHIIDYIKVFVDKKNCSILRTTNNTLTCKPEEKITYDSRIAIHVGETLKFHLPISYHAKAEVTLVVVLFFSALFFVIVLISCSLVQHNLPFDFFEYYET